MNRSPESYSVAPSDIPDELKGLSLENVEQMRAKQRVDLRLATNGKAFMESDDYKTARDEAYGEFDAHREALLDSQNIDENHPKRQEYLDYLRNLSIDQIPDHEWYTGARQTDGSLAPSGRDRTREAFHALVGNVAHNPTKTTKPGSYEVLAPEVYEKLNETRAEYSSLISERTTKIFESKTKSTEIDVAYEDFSDMVSALATDMMLKCESEGLDEAATRVEIDKLINEKVDEVVADVEAERASAYEKRSPLMKRFLRKWASWGGKGEKIFSKERFKGNLKKGALFALPTAALAAATAPVLGVVGAGLGVGVGVAAGAGLVGRSMARRFASNKLDDTANAQTIANKQAEEMRRRMNEQRSGTEDENLHSLLDVVHERSQAYRKRNQRRLMGSMAIAAASAFVGSTAGNLIHDAVVDGHVGDWISNKFHHDSNAASNGDKGSSRGGGHEPSEQKPRGTIDKPPVQPKALTYDQVFDGNRGTTHLTNAGKADFAKWLHGREVKSGDSVWKLAEQYQKSHHLSSSVYSTDAIKDYGVKYLQGKGYADSRGWLNKGDIIK